MNNRVSVIGAGAFGTALAVQLIKARNEVKIWSFEEKVRDEINDLHQNLTYLPDIRLTSGIAATSNLEEAHQFSDFIFLASPFFSLRSVLPKEGSGKIFILASKGIEKDSHKLGSEIVEEIIKGNFETLVLSGPSFAKELGEGKDTKVILAGSNPEALEKVRGLIESENFKVELSEDTVGTQLSGALKTVLAILAGMSAGTDFGKNFRAAVFTEGIREMTRIGEALGAKKETFYSVAGLGDLFLTATTDLSRNFNFGFRLGQGEGREKASQGKTVEGIGTAESAYHLAQKFGIKAPLFYNVYAAIFQGKDTKQALEDIWKEI